ncbi:TolC family protein [bacterium]|nr:TolC family protein [bacterium]
MNVTATVVVSALSLVLAVVPVRSEPPRVLRLGEAVQLALGKSPDLATAQHRLAAARAGWRQTGAAFWPQVRLSGTYTGSDNPVQAFMMTLNQRAFDFGADFNDPPATDNLNTKVLAVYSLYNGGRDSAARAAARLGAGAQEEMLNAARNDLVFEVVRAFHEIGKARQFVAVADAALKSMEANLGVASNRFAEGAVLKSDVLDAAVRLAQAREDVVRARNALALAELQFRTVLGVGDTENVTAGEENGPPPHPSPQTTAAPASPPAGRGASTGDPLSPPGERVGVRGQSLAAGDESGGAPARFSSAEPALDISRRPELAAAEKAVGIAERRLRAAWGGHLPRVNAFASYDLDSGDAERFADSWVAGVSVEVNVFDGFLTRGKVAEARANVEAARARLHQTELQLQWEARQARLNLEAAAARLETTAKAVDQAEESLQITKDRYQGGLALLTQVLDAETALTAARQRRVMAEADQRIAAAALRRTLGQGWEE